MDGTQTAAMLASQVDVLKQAAPDPQIDFFRRGINSVAAHMFAESFGREGARLAGARAALVTEYRAVFVFYPVS